MTSQSAVDSLWFAAVSGSSPREKARKLIDCMHADSRRRRGFQAWLRASALLRRSLFAPPSSLPSSLPQSSSSAPIAYQPLVDLVRRRDRTTLELLIDTEPAAMRAFRCAAPGRSLVDVARDAGTVSGCKGRIIELLSHVCESDAWEWHIVSERERDPYRGRAVYLT
jgi:hypothetical protein